jgi:hypothetical protein
MSYTSGSWVVETPRDRYKDDPAWREWSESYPCGVVIRSKWDKPDAIGSLGYQICAMSGVSDVTLPNARLIAAAPDLLEALKLALPYVEKAPDESENFLIREDIMLAIAKAEGR